MWKKKTQLSVPQGHMCDRTHGREDARNNPRSDQSSHGDTNNFQKIAKLLGNEDSEQRKGRKKRETHT